MKLTDARRHVREQMLATVTATVQPAAGEQLEQVAAGLLGIEQAEALEVFDMAADWVNMVSELAMKNPASGSWCMAMAIVEAFLAGALFGANDAAEEVES